MHAIILAAGMGKRLKELTQHATKCMIKVDGVTLIERALDQLDKLFLKQIVIVTGYQATKLIDFISELDIKTPIIYVENPIYYKTNNIYSLYLAKDYLMDDDTLLLESDLIFEDSVLKKLLEDPYPSLALVSKYESWMDGTVVTVDSDYNIKSFLGKKDFVFQNAANYYKTVNIYKFSKNFSITHYVPFLEAYSKALGYNEYYEQVLKVITLLDRPEIKALPLDGQNWYEIDDIQDLDIAESIFAGSANEKYKKIISRKGGYWRYPNMLDFSSPQNTLFPTFRLNEEIKANFQTLISKKNSDANTNNLLASKYFGLKKENILSVNGISALLPFLFKNLTGNLGVVVPTSVKYTEEMQSRIIAFCPANPDFCYTSKDLIGYFSDKDITNLFIINPDNPSGNYIEKTDLLEVAQWTLSKNIRLIVDESFLSYVSTYIRDTLLNQEILSEYPNIVVVKSISQAFGVQGLRLGVLATENRKFLMELQKETPIWSINSFAEFFLQIFEKYQDEYNGLMENYCLIRDEFAGKLSQISYLRVIPSQSNYITCEIISNYSATELAEKMMSEANIMIKDLSCELNAKGEFVRIAIRSCNENDMIINHLKKFNFN